MFSLSCLWNNVNELKCFAGEMLWSWGISCSEVAENSWSVSLCDLTAFIDLTMKAVSFGECAMKAAELWEMKAVEIPFDISAESIWSAMEVV